MNALDHRLEADPQSTDPGVQLAGRGSLSFFMVLPRLGRSVARLLEPRVALGQGRWPSFKVCGYTGFALALAQSVLLVRVIGLSELTLFGIATVSIATFFTLAMVTKIVVGKEFLIYYYQEIALLCLTALFLRLTHHPVLAYLDIEALGIGTFLACGRVGCLLVGCCHGRPCRWGTMYKDEHAHAGFPAHLTGVRLFPIQIVESGIVMGLVIFGVIILLSRRQPGQAFVSYLVLCGVSRFILEFFRGDKGRNFLWGFSEAQWTSLWIETAVVFAERGHVLPSSRWHSAVPALMVATMACLKIWWLFDRAKIHELLHPRHVDEIASALSFLKSPPAVSYGFAMPPEIQSPVHVAETSRGYRFSLGESWSEGRSIRHFSISKEGGQLSQNAARALGRLIGQLESDAGECTIVPGRTGVFHLLRVRDPSSSACARKYP